MSPLSCSFCSHPNPLDAKFCNQCGSPLGLKPCASCEAVNEQSAERCHQCGAALIAAPADVAATVEGPMAADAAASARAEQSAQASAGAGDVRASPSGDDVNVAAPLAVGERASLPGDEAIVAAPFAIDAARDAPVHIPESFADRLERDIGPHAFERVEPRMAPSDDAGAHDFAAASHPLRNRRMAAHGRAWRAPLALAVVVAIAGAGYYAYRQDAPGIDRLAAFALAGWRGGKSATAERESTEAPPAARGVNDAATNAPPAPPQAVQGSANAAMPATAAQGTANAAMPATAAPGAASAATPGTASSDASPASQANPAASALVSVEPGAPGRAATDGKNGAGAPAGAAKGTSSPASRNDEGSAPQRSEAPGRSRRRADADAIATQRLIARDLGIAESPPPTDAPAAPLDRDAAETRRLIERDLGPFLHRNGGSSRPAYLPSR